MAGTRECNSTVIAGRLSKAVEFFDAAEHLEDDMPNAAGDVVDAGIAAADVICCVRLGVHSNSGTHQFNRSSTWLQLTAVQEAHWTTSRVANPSDIRLWIKIVLNCKNIVGPAGFEPGDHLPPRKWR